jgi:hypothetical protein
VRAINGTLLVRRVAARHPSLVRTKWPLLHIGNDGTGSFFYKLTEYCITLQDCRLPSHIGNSSASYPRTNRFTFFSKSKPSLGVFTKSVLLSSLKNPRGETLFDQDRARTVLVLVQRPLAFAFKFRRARVVGNHASTAA